MKFQLIKEYKQPIFLLIALLLVVFSFMLINRLNVTLQNYITTPKFGYSQDKPYAEQEVKIVNGEYEFKYVFKDQDDQLTPWNWSLNKDFVDNLNANFGLASDFPDFTKLSSAIVR